MRERYDWLGSSFAAARPMGWLEKLSLLCICIPLCSSFCLAGSTATAIATPSTTQPFGQVDQAMDHNNQPILQNHRLATDPVLNQPVVSGMLPHLTRAASSRPLVASFPSLNSQQFDQQLQRYLRFLAQFGQPDILIVGSSRALQGIDPIVLQQTLARRGYPTLKIFNFGVNGATAQLVDLLLRKLLTPDQLPRLLLWGDGVRAFNSGRIDITYKRAIASPGYELLTVGIRPVLVPAESFPPRSPCLTAPLQRPTHEVLNQPKYFNFVPPFNRVLKQQYLCRESLKTLSQPEAPAKPDTITTNLWELTGFQAASEQFKPNEYFQRYPRVRGEYDADYRDFTLNGQQTDAFKNIVAFAKARQIPLVFVNLPLTQIYLDETRTANEQQFRTYLQRFARSQPLNVHDLSQRWLHQNAYFTDPSHLNRYGAAAVADQLGRLLIPPTAQP